jgi:succinate dehydrogenase / fumarate reductase membrane anchor subunit
VHRRGCPTGSRGIIYEWWWLRITAALLVPLSVWFVTALVTHLLGAETFTLQVWLANRFVAIAMVILLAAAFIHAQLGLHEIIIDYAHGGTKKFLSFLADFLSLVLAIASIAAVVHLHMAN